MRGTPSYWRGWSYRDTMSRMKALDNLGIVCRLALALANARFKQRIAGRYLGIFWYMLEPLAFFLILLFLQANIVANTIPQYPAYLLLGIIMLNFFVSSTTNALASMRESKNLIQSVNIRTEALPLATVIQFCYSHMFEFALFVVTVLIIKDFSWNVVWYLPVFFFYAIFVLGCSYILATAGVFIEDFKNVWTVLSRLIWLGTPVFYALTDRNLLYLANLFNPLYYFLLAARDAVIYGIMPDCSLLLSLPIFSLAVLVFGLAIFERYKRRFAEFI